MPDLPPAAQHAADVVRAEVRAQAERAFEGEANLQAALNWASTGLDPGTRDRLNAALASDPASAATAITHLKTAYTGAQRARADADLRAAGVPSTRAEYEAVRSRAQRGDAAARRSLRAISPGRLAKILL